LASPLIPPRHRSITARLAALLALAGCIVALILIVHAFQGEEDSSTTPSAKTGKTHNTKKQDKKNAIPKTYTVHEGDNLGTISQQFGVPVPRIEKLNDKIDTQVLNPGQQIFLR
jgi:LysM repeat protein